MNLGEESRSSLTLEDAAGRAESDGGAQTGPAKLLILLGVGLVIFLMVPFYSIGDYVDKWKVLIDDGGPMAAAYLVLLTAGFMAIGVPRLPFYALAGYAFGFAGGLALALCGSVIGSFVMFRAARWGGRAWLVEHFGSKPVVTRIMGTKPTVLAVALVRMLPISNGLINIGLSLSEARNRVFLGGTLLGFLPQGVVVTLVSAGVADDVRLERAVELGAVGFGVLLLLAWAARRLPHCQISATRSSGA